LESVNVIEIEAKRYPADFLRTFPVIPLDRENRGIAPNDAASTPFQAISIERVR
jgi:hypothetical protein